MYWLPPKVMSRQKIEVAPERTLTFVTEAPTLTSARTFRVVDRVVHLVGVLEREGVDVDEHRDLAGLADHRRVVVDLFLLHGDEDDVDVVAGAGRARAGRSRG